MEVATMSFVTERNEIAFLTADDKYGLIKFMNRKAYRVSDTSLTYRQINYLDKDGLLGDDTRQGGKGWRLFSLKEVVYLLMVVELKKYGFTQDWLRPICHTLLVAGKKETPNKHMFDELIGLCLGGLEINAVAYNDGPLLFYDPTFYALNREGKMKVSGTTSFVLIRLNDLVNEALKMLDKKPVEPSISVAGGYLDRLAKPNGKLSEKEQRVVEALRNQNYLSIEVRKKNGELDTMKVEALEQYLDSQSEVINLIKSKAYSDIRLVKRDGKVVHLQTKDTVKL